MRRRREGDDDEEDCNDDGDDDCRRHPRRRPKHSPDLNAIEGFWKMLKQRLESTEPEAFECRSDFLARLRRAVTWLNEDRQSELRALYTNQKDRPRAVIALKGAKCRW